MLESTTGNSQQPPIAQLYRERARHALSLARKARLKGNFDAALGLADEALLWRAYAMDWARRRASLSI